MLEIVTLWETYLATFKTKEKAESFLKETYKNEGIVPLEPKPITVLTDGINYYKLGTSVYVTE